MAFERVGGVVVIEDLLHPGNHNRVKKRTKLGSTLFLLDSHGFKICKKKL